MSSNAGAGAGGSGREAAIQKAAKPDTRTVAQRKGKVTTKTGKAVTDSQGRATVLTSEGVRQKAEAEQRFVARKDPETVRKEAISELEGRYESALGISRLSLGMQLDALRKGAQPVQTFTSSGKLLTVGSISKEGVYSGRSEYGDAARAQATTGKPVTLSTQQLQLEATRARQDAPQAPVAAAPVEEEAATILAQTGSGSRTRGARSKRFGGAGTILEGTGALYG